ncbi:MAG: hypothetical protein J3R72DRAFT_461655 [Linnemannia gamsii]|nr:MAG: hypothetical protein J3R72DRAFT_461655 [Linnemannia gamsii]
MVWNCVHLLVLALFLRCCSRLFLFSSLLPLHLPHPPLPLAVVERPVCIKNVLPLLCFPSLLPLPLIEHLQFACTSISSMHSLSVTFFYYFFSCSATTCTDGPVPFHA